MPENFHNIHHLFDFYENVLPPGFETRERDLKSLSLRIPSGAHEELDRLSERWGVSKSALAALLLETALHELELLEESQFQQGERRKAEEARKAAL